MVAETTRSLNERELRSMERRKHAWELLQAGTTDYDVVVKMQQEKFQGASLPHAQWVALDLARRLNISNPADMTHATLVHVVANERQRQGYTKTGRMVKADSPGRRPASRPPDVKRPVGRPKGSKTKFRMGVPVAGHTKTVGTKELEAKTALSPLTPFNKKAREHLTEAFREFPPGSILEVTFKLVEGKLRASGKMMAPTDFDVELA